MLRKSRRGVAAVEFAVAAPVLFALVLGLVELGRVMFVLNQMSNAAREGCRVAALGNVLDSSDVTSVVNNHLVSTALPTLDVNVTPQNLNTVSPGDAISVALSVKYADASWIPIADVVGDATIRIEKRIIRE